MTPSYESFKSSRSVYPSDKKAIGCTISALALLIAGEEDLLPSGLKGWLDGEFALSGSIKETRYRDFVNFVRTAMRSNPKKIASHPYFVPNVMLLDIDKPSSRLGKFYADENAPETFDMDKYIDLTCKTDENGKITGLKESVLNGDDSKKDALSDAFYNFFNKIRSYSPEAQK